MQIPRELRDSLDGLTRFHSDFTRFSVNAVSSLWLTGDAPDFIDHSSSIRAKFKSPVMLLRGYLSHNKFSVSSQGLGGN